MGTSNLQPVDRSPYYNLDLGWHLNLEMDCKIEPIYLWDLMQSPGR